MIVEESDQPIDLNQCISSMPTSAEKKQVDVVSPNCNWSLPLEIRKERRRIASTRPIQTDTLDN